MISDLVLELVITLKLYGQIHTKLDVDTQHTENEISSKNSLFVIMETQDICLAHPCTKLVVPVQNVQLTFVPGKIQDFVQSLEKLGFPHLIPHLLRLTLTMRLKTLDLPHKLELKVKGFIRLAFGFFYA